ncbi:MAG TPA: Plug domain-containing protein [Ignavibacteriaceae bacterium]|nr:Plug domain-containing protein [Ignavibacteriaceae bacterium]
MLTFFAKENILIKGILLIIIIFLSAELYKSFGQETDSVRRWDFDDIIITDTREGQKKKEITATVDQINLKEIEVIKPTHPSAIMGLIPGVWVNVTGGEGHMTSIRQPLTTNPVYLYLEDGIPARSTGFFNHNAN